MRTRREPRCEKRCRTCSPVGRAPTSASGGAPPPDPEEFDPNGTQWEASPDHRCEDVEHASGDGEVTRERDGGRREAEYSPLRSSKTLGYHPKNCRQSGHIT